MPRLPAPSGSRIALAAPPWRPHTGFAVACEDIHQIAGDPGGIAVHGNREIGQTMPQLRPIGLEGGESFREGAYLGMAGLHPDDGLSNGAPAAKQLTMPSTSPPSRAVA